MKKQLILSTDAALILKEHIVDSMPARPSSPAPSMELLLWVTLRRVAKKIHNRLFDAPQTLSLSLSVTEELALYTLLTQTAPNQLLATDSNLLLFLREVDRRLKDNVFLTDPSF